MLPHGTRWVARPRVVSDASCRPSPATVAATATRPNRSALDSRRRSAAAAGPAAAGPAPDPPTDRVATAPAATEPAPTSAGSSAVAATLPRRPNAYSPQ